MSKSYTYKTHRMLFIIYSSFSVHVSLTQLVPVYILFDAVKYDE